MKIQAQDKTVINERGVLAMTSTLLYEVHIRSFLIWCYEEFGEKMKFKHHDTIYKVINVDDLGYVTGLSEQGIKVNLSPREVINKLPNKVVRFFKEEWIG